MCSLRTPALDLPGLVHGFDMGASAAPGVDRETGRSRIRAALEGEGVVYFLTQVHGSAVLNAPWTGALEGDGGLAREAGQIVAIETADCVPLLLVDPEAKLVAAVHAGWRGTAATIAARGVAALLAAGARVRRLVAVLGPSIGPCCYEVGDELRDRFGPRASALFHVGPRGRPHLDLGTANVAQLLDAGMDPERIHRVPVCTCCDPVRPPSYRRDGPGCGRIVSYVGWRRSAVEA
jgi:YfiH family protein